MGDKRNGGKNMTQILSNFAGLTVQMVIMWIIGAIMIYLAIKKEMEPTLLLPMGFGCILCNMPNSGMVHTLEVLFQAGVDNELFPLLLFIGIGAMIDFGPVLSDPKLLLFGAAAQFGIFFTLSMASLLGFELRDAASIAIIGAADGPTSIFVSQQLKSNYTAAIIVAAYSYMALVPIVQPACIKLCTTREERMIRMEYTPGQISKTTRILFPIVVSIIASLVAPDSAALVGFLMFGNLLRECGVLKTLSEAAQNILANLISLLLGLTVAVRMQAESFLVPETLMILGLGLVAFCFDTFGGVFFGKFLNLFSKKKINPMVGAAGISAFPMSSRVIAKMAREEDPYNFILMQAAGANVAGQVASVIAGGLILAMVGPLVL